MVSVQTTVYHKPLSGFAVPRHTDDIVEVTLVMPVSSRLYIIVIVFQNPSGCITYLLLCPQVLVGPWYVDSQRFCRM
jgi:hypothetical protein